MASNTESVLASLPDVFHYTEAVRRIGERPLRLLVASGAVVPLSGGVYRKDEALGDDDLIEIAARSARATLCLRTALEHHDLIDDIPTVIDVAVPRGSWTPATQARVQWHHFDARTFEIGRETLQIPSGKIGLYSAERSIIDAFRFRHREGTEMATEALKTWLRHGGQPSTLLATAKAFPRTIAAVRSALEVLL
ncbi:hypothetical protein GCM10009785_18340 [Brooklawnia cerclae]|uniref:Transcriptional regulator n=1 Tax=Brooklawnia cerclae TaxID=349934 RepID=A0ABX0SGY2_9ACTN|nr:hypothetical protein [Brooklawnia cerclae]NIH57594.1 hypothetical protein [Brooklawnia cerclae]